MTTESLESVKNVRSVIGIRRDGHITKTVAARPSPHYASLEMIPDPVEVSGARRWAEFVTAGWKLAGIHDAVGIVVSELLTNAIAACATDSTMPPALLIQMLLDPESLCIAVRDNHPFAVPHLAPVQDDDEHGRGLHMVDALCTAWGWYATKQAKVVWGELPLSPPGAATPSVTDG